MNTPTPKPTTIPPENRYPIWVRAAALAVLLGMTFAAGRYLLPKQSGSGNQSSDDMADASGSDAGNKCNGSDDPPKHPRLIFVSRPEIFEEEAKERYEEREKERLEDRALEVCDELAITDTEDCEKITRAVRQGCTEIFSSNGVNVKLDPPPNPACEDIDLNHDTGKRWIDPKYYDPLPDDAKAAVDLYRSKDTEGFLKSVSFDSTRQLIGNFQSENYPGEEAQARSLFEGVLDELEAAQQAYRNSDIARACELFGRLAGRLKAFDSESVDEATEGVLGEMDGGENSLPQSHVELFMEIMGEELDYFQGEIQACASMYE